MCSFLGICLVKTRRLEALTWDALVDEWVHTVTLVIRGK